MAGANFMGMILADVCGKRSESDEYHESDKPDCRAEGQFVGV